MLGLLSILKNLGLVCSAARDVSAAEGFLERALELTRSHLTTSITPQPMGRGAAYAVGPNSKSPANGTGSAAAASISASSSAGAVRPHPLQAQLTNEMALVGFLFFRSRQTSILTLLCVQMYAANNRPTDAWPLFARALTLAESALGRTHPETLLICKARTEFARIHRKDESEKEGAEWLSRTTSQCGPSHPLTLGCGVSVAKWLGEGLSKWKDAEKYEIVVGFARRLCADCGSVFHAASISLLLTLQSRIKPNHQSFVEIVSALVALHIAAKVRTSPIPVDPPSVSLIVRFV